MKTNPYAGHLRRWTIATAAALALAGFVGAAQAADNFTFFLISDIHLGINKPKENPPVLPEQSVKNVRQTVSDLLALAYAPYPERGPFKGQNFGPVPEEVKGLLIAGDLTDGAPTQAELEAQWKMYSDIFPVAGLALKGGMVPVYPCIGNHDGDPKGPVRQGLIAQNRERLKAGTISALSDNGVHYAVRWGDLHVICVNLYPADGPDLKMPFKFGDGGQPGKWNDPQGALSFMTNYLQKVVGKSGQPVIIMQHYGFIGFSLNDWNWWTPQLRRQFYDAIKDYNVVALFHGHDHASQHYFWPDAQAHPEEVKLLFGDNPPADLKRYDVFAAGRLTWVFRVQNGKFLAMHHNGKDWTNIPGLMAVKSLSPAKP